MNEPEKIVADLNRRLPCCGGLSAVGHTDACPVAIDQWDERLTNWIFGKPKTQQEKPDGR